MSFVRVKRAKEFDIEISDIASDKSISHRSAIFSLLSQRSSTIKNYLRAEDTLNTLNIVKLLGAEVEDSGDSIKIVPPKEIKEPPFILDCGNSGTAMRLFMGFLASQKGFFVLHGDRYLASRPMKRVADPLRKIGAKIDGRVKGNLSPIAIRGAKLEGFEYKSPISSAQVKSAMILAALHAKEMSIFSEPILSRDHTERMLLGMGAEIVSDKDKIKIMPLVEPLLPLDIEIPNDPSSAFFFAVAAAITPNSRVVLQNVSLNPTRIEAYKVLQKMGTHIDFILKDEKYEPVGDIVVQYGELSGVEVSGNISWLIDELPALSIAMAFANGKSVVKNAKELRVKESDRITSVVENLKKCGIDAVEHEDGYEIVGSKFNDICEVDSYGDHRVAMSFLVAGLRSDLRVNDTECINTSFPNFLDIIKRVGEVEYGD